MEIHDVPPRRSRYPFQAWGFSWDTFKGVYVPDDLEMIKSFGSTELAARIADHKMKTLRYEVNYMERPEEVEKAIALNDDIIKDLKTLVEDQQKDLANLRIQSMMDKLTID